MNSDETAPHGPEEPEHRVEDAERKLRRADLLDERSVVRASKRRHFWLTAKWLVPGAVLSALGVSLGAWDALLALLAFGLLAVAVWVFTGANARDDQIADELRQLDSEAGGSHRTSERANGAETDVSEELSGWSDEGTWPPE